MKVNAMTNKTHKLFEESHWVSRLRENLTSGSDGEGLETGQLVPRQSFTRQDLFNQLKNRWGWRESWQQSRQVLHRWTQIVSVAFALPQLLAIYCGDQVENLMHLTPWRKRNPLTAGRVRLGFQMILGNVRVRDWWNPTCRKFQPPLQANKWRIYSKQVRPWVNMMSKNKMAEENPPPPP